MGAPNVKLPLKSWLSSFHLILVHIINSSLNLIYIYIYIKKIYIYILKIYIYIYIYILKIYIYIYIYIKNSSDNLTKSFMIHKMYHCQYMILKEIHIIFVSMIICSVADHFIITYTRRKRNK